MRPEKNYQNTEGALKALAEQFGGVKLSGYGRELSHYGIKEFVNIQTIWVK